ncbi:trafficking protein particle complex subunit 2 [Pelomyxa schiedti]|nr:trafficking protein particle complex subunit 2 [Pelomyxa schiedti]
MSGGKGGMVCMFVIVGTNDNPIYEADFSAPKQESMHLNHFILHSALDLVDEQKWKVKDMYLKAVDRFAKMSISAWVTSGHVKFLLLHNKEEDSTVKFDTAIRTFFTEVHELYLKVLLNPFYVPNTTITSTAFDTKVRRLGQRIFMQ